MMLNRMLTPGPKACPPALRLLAPLLFALGVPCGAWLPAPALPVPAAPAPGGEARIVGQLLPWHTLEVWFEGPRSAELDSAPNPFLDFRLQVTFQGPSGQSYELPGFYDGDGLGGGSGPIWKVRFRPDEPGIWDFEASFRGGPAVAVELDPQAGAATHFDGLGGSLEVGAALPDAPGFLRHGRLEYVGEHYLRFRDGTYFLKGGTNSPENLLGFSGFDGVVDQGGKGIVHDYGPHVGDWRQGDPEIGGKRGLIGALNYMQSVGLNSVYFLPMNLGGDGQETCPFVGYQKTSFDKTHYDISRLAQWNTAFEHAQRLGIQLQFVLAETEPANESWLDNGQVGVERKLFFRELAARFGHSLALKWNLSEENDFSLSGVQQMAEYLRAVDPYDHPIAIHTRGEEFGIYTQTLGDPAFSATSMQFDGGLAGAHVEDWRALSAAAGHPWVMDMDENNPAAVGLTPDNADELRKQILYDVYLSGGNIEWFLGSYPLPVGGDVNLEDFRTREEMWTAMRHAREFLQQHTPFWRMQPADDLLAAESDAFGGGEVFAAPGEVYVVYLPDASLPASLDLGEAAGSYRQRWFDPRSGQLLPGVRFARGGVTVDLGLPPSDIDEDWVCLLDRRSLLAEVGSIELVAGGQQVLELDAGPGRAGDPYLLLGSFSGTTPGTPIPGAGNLPLNADPWTIHTLFNPNALPFVGSAGILDEAGRGTARIVLPPTWLPQLVGLEVHHAYVSGAPLSFSSNAVPLVFE